MALASLVNSVSQA